MTLKPCLGVIKVIENYTIQSGTHDFLLTFHSIGLSRTVSEINGKTAISVENRQFFPSPWPVYLTPPPSQPASQPDGIVIVAPNSGIAQHYHTVLRVYTPPGVFSFTSVTMYRRNHLCSKIKLILSLNGHRHINSHRNAKRIFF